MQDLDETALTKAAENAWASFLGSRFDGVLSAYDGPSQRTARIRIADIELAVMHTALAHANQRRNATSVAASLPAELLAMIFSAAAEVWAPLRIQDWTERAKAEKEKDKPLCYDLGWIFLSHVCSSWRKAAVCSPHLWVKVECLGIPPQFTVDVLLRSKRLPLEVSIHDDIIQKPEQYGKSASIISSWLCGPTLLCTRKLVLKTLTSIFEHLQSLNDIAPVLEEFSLNLDRETWMPEDMLSVSTASGLRRLDLCCCFPQWARERPSMPCNLTTLHLGGEGWRAGGIDVSYYPSISEFQAFLMSLPQLEKLSLSDFFPSRENDLAPPMVFHFPSTLKRVDLGCAWAQFLEKLQDDFWRYFKFPSTSVVVSRITADDFVDSFGDGDGGIFQPIFELDNKTVPAQELYVSTSNISIRHSLETARRNWTWCWWTGRRAGSPSWEDPDFFYDTARGSRHIQSSVDDLYHFLDVRFPLETIRALFLSRETPDYFTSAASWLNTFVVQCSNVERLSFSFPGSSTLLSAMSLQEEGDTHGQGHGTFKLFPILKVLVLHAGSVLGPTIADTTARDKYRAARDISLVYMLDARREAGWSIEELLVDRALQGWDVWGKLGEDVTVSYFD